MKNKIYTFLQQFNEKNCVIRQQKSIIMLIKNLGIIHDDLKFDEYGNLLDECK